MENSPDTVTLLALETSSISLKYKFTALYIQTMYFISRSLQVETYVHMPRKFLVFFPAFKIETQNAYSIDLLQICIDLRQLPGHQDNKR